MKVYSIFIKNSARKELDQLPQKQFKNVIIKLRKLEVEPRPKSSKKLRGREGYRLRVGNYRVLYLINEKEKHIDIVSVGHRKDIYK